MNIDIKLVVFSIISDSLSVYLADGKLPYGILEESLTTDRTAEAVFKKDLKIPLKNIYFEQLYTFSKNSKISIVYYFLVPEHKIYSNSRWVNVDNVKINHTDTKIISYAVQRLRWKIEYTNAVYSLLPDEFSFSQLQSVYEAILRKTLDKRNFRKKIMMLGILRDTGHIKKRGRARPAEMFSFKKKRLTFVRIL